VAPLLEEPLPKELADAGFPGVVNLMGRYSFPLQEALTAGHLRPLQNPQNPKTDSLDGPYQDFSLRLSSQTTTGSISRN
jgi:hypothetical protein